MSLYDVFVGQQSWAAYINNKDLIKGFDRSLTRSEDRTIRAILRPQAYAVAQQSGLSAVANDIESAVGDLNSTMGETCRTIQIGFDRLAEGIDQLKADFNLLLGDVTWKLELHNNKLQSILDVLQAPLETAAKELRNRAENAYHFGWYQEALQDFLEAERRNYQDFIVHRSIGHIYLYHLIDLPKAVEYFRKSAKYARPRDVRLCAEANYFAAVASAARHQLRDAQAHLQTATDLNNEFTEAYVMSACVAAMIGEADIAIQSLATSIDQDLRYFERARVELMLEPLRDRVDQLLVHLRQTEVEDSHRALDDLRSAIDVARHSPGCVLADADRVLTMLQSRADSGRVLDMRSVTLEAHSWVLVVTERANAQKHINRLETLLESLTKTSPDIDWQDVRDALVHMQQIAADRTWQIRTVAPGASRWSATIIDRAEEGKKIELLRAEHEKQKCIQELSAVISGLRKRQSDLELAFKPRRMGWGSYVGLWLLWVVLLRLAIRNAPAAIVSAVMLPASLASFAFPFVAIRVLNVVNQRRSVTKPVDWLKAEILGKEQMRDSERDRITRECERRKSQIRAELEQIRSLRTVR